MSQQVHHSPPVTHFWMLGSRPFICVGELSNSVPSHILEKQNNNTERGRSVRGGKMLTTQVSTCYQVISYVIGNSLIWNLEHALYGSIL